MKFSIPPSHSDWPDTLLRRYFPFWHLAMRGGVRALAPRFRVSGQHNRAWKTPVIYVPNHTSDFDPVLVFVSLRQPAWYMAKSELFDDYPKLAPILRFAHTFPVDQNGFDRKSLDASLEVLRRGESLVVFPEGHCSKDGELGPLEAGASLLALRAGVPIVPVGISGSTAILPYAQLRPHPTLFPVHVHFGAAIELTNLSELTRREARAQATQRIETGIRDALRTARS